MRRFPTVVSAASPPPSSSAPSPKRGSQMSPDCQHRAGPKWGEGSGHLEIGDDRARWRREAVTQAQVYPIDHSFLVLAQYHPAPVEKHDDCRRETVAQREVHSVATLATAASEAVLVDGGVAHGDKRPGEVGPHDQPVGPCSADYEGWDWADSPVAVSSTPARVREISELRIVIPIWWLRGDFTASLVLRPQLTR